jgi:DNA-binding XRE family transcriptional regulator
MSTPARRLAAALDLNPRDAAIALAEARKEQGDWLDEFATELDRHRASSSLARTLSNWGLSQSDAARLFGVSRQAVSKWLEQGVPPERAETMADLGAATDFLVHYVKRERIPAVVRRPAPALDNRSLLDLVAAGDSRGALVACREMFAFDRAHN